MASGKLAQQRDFFSLDIDDVVFKDDIASMEHPIFSLTTAPRMRPLIYEHGNSIVKIIPSGVGLPTVFDKDVLIFCISTLVSRKNRGQPYGPSVKLSARELMLATQRHTNDRGYKRFEQALQRLRGTTIQTTIQTGGQDAATGTSLITEYSLVRKPAITGRLTGVTITLSDWMFRAVESMEVLTIHAGYFQLRRPLERRLYELARKHCGKQKEWFVALDLLQKKTGSGAPLRRFRFNLREIITEDPLPEYHYALDDDDRVKVTRKAGEPTDTKATKVMAKPAVPSEAIPDETSEEQRKAVAEGMRDLLASLKGNTIIGGRS